MYKLKQLYPKRNYNRAISLPELSQPSQPSPKPIVRSNDGYNGSQVKPLNDDKKISTESTPSSIDGKFRCFYCEHVSQDNLERIKHIDIEHPGRLHHPTQEDFENHLGIVIKIVRR